MDFLANLAAGLLHVLGRLVMAFESPGEYNSLMLRLGWSAELDAGGYMQLRAAFAATDPFENLENLFDQITSGTGDPVALAEQLVGGLIAILNQIRSVVAAPPSTLPEPLNDPSFWSQSGVELVDLLLIDFLEIRQPQLESVLLLIGFIDISPASPTGPNRLPYIRRTVHWDRLPQLINDPEGLIRSVYGWGGPALDVARFFDVSQRIFRGLHLAARIEPLDAAMVARYYSAGNPALPMQQLAIPLVSSANADRSSYAEFGVALFPIPPAGQPTSAPVGFGIAPLASGTLSSVGTSDSPFTLSVGASFQANDTFVAELRPGTADLAILSGSPTIDAALSITGQPATPWILFGDAQGSRLEVSGLSAGLEVKGSAAGLEVIVTAGAVGQAADGTNGARLVIDFGSGDGFLQKMIGSGTEEIDLSGTFRWSSQSGLSINGQAKMVATIPLHLSIAGVLDIDSLTIALAASGSAAALDVSITGGLTLGPINATVDQVGVALLITPVPAGGPAGNLDKLDLGFGFKPPSGLGLLIDMGVVVGGGYISFDPAAGRYAGVLELSLADIVTVKVIGVLDTKMPDGSSGFSFLLIITFDLPPIQLGFGFTLTGVGGLGGVNRTMVLDALRAGLRAHTLDSVMFPADPINNAPRIISDIESFFPPQEGRHLFGPMLALGWGSPTLLNFEVGVILEVPDPIRLAILGMIRVSIPSPDFALIQIKIDVLGTVDFGLQKLGIDGTMYDSYLLEFQIAGDMALRFNWGSNPDFLFSLGGFNPHFSPPPDVPQLQRLSVSIGVGDNPRLSSNSYFAVTSNTLQFGANVDAYASAGGFAVHGYIGFDTIFIFSPFSFEIDFSAGFDISYDGHSLAGITLNASLQGPRPWHLHGDADFHILFFDISASIDLSWGDSTPATLPSAPVMPPLVAALGDPRNWSVALPPVATQCVTLRSVPADPTMMVAHPMGTVSVRETIVPLDLPITKFNNATPSDGNEFGISAVTFGALPDTTPVIYQPYQEQFAIAQFTDMSDADKISAPSYEPFHAGVTIGGLPIANGHDSMRTVTYEERYIDDYQKQSRFGRFYTMPANVHASLIGSGASGASVVRNSGLQSYVENGMESAISVAKITYVLASTVDLSIRTDIPNQGGTRYQALAAMQVHLVLHPEDKDQLQILTTYEVAS